MLIVYDKNRRALGDLVNAFNVTETQKINEAYLFSFSMPRNDPKNEYCQPLNYVRYNNGHLYRIMPAQDTITETGEMTYQCEHVILTLLDSIIMGYHKIGNRGTYTRQVIEYILDKQDKTFNIITKQWQIDRNKRKNWVLGECDLRREFEYAWTNESLLSALWGVPSPIPDKYMWTYNTVSYPWTLNLKVINQTQRPQFYISSGKNLVSLTQVSDPAKLTTRIWPLGEGEGQKQLNISSVNSGVPYVQSDAAHIAQYGLIEKVFEDRRYTDAESLLETAKTLLNELQEPYNQFQVEFATLQNSYYDVPEIGKIVDVAGLMKTYIVGILYNHDEIPLSKLEIANKPQDVSASFADITQRAQIDAAYGQGYTNFLPSHEYGNATPSFGLVLNFMIPQEITEVERVPLTVGISAFRYPFNISAVNGQTTTISQSVSTTDNTSTNSTGSAGDGNTGSAGSGNTGNSGGYNGRTSDSGNRDGSTGIVQEHRDLTSIEPELQIRTDMSGQEIYTGPVTNTEIEDVPSRHDHIYLLETRDHFHFVEIPRHYHEYAMFAHSHTINSSLHNHSFSVPAHSHSMPSHTHSIGRHSHSMAHTHRYAHTHNIRQHDHRLEPVISITGSPSSFIVKLDGATIRIVTGLSASFDIIDWVYTASKGTLHTLEVIPNSPAWVMIDMLIQGFANTKGDAMEV